MKKIDMTEEEMERYAEASRFLLGREDPTLDEVGPFNDAKAKKPKAPKSPDQIGLT
jgi:hypothetical protein